MNSISNTAPRARRRAFLALLAMVLLLVLAQAVPAFAAQRPDYTGGPILANNDGKADFPLYVPNDHTVSALRFTADAGTLRDVDNNPVTTAGVQYYVKIRLTPNADGAPAGADNRGFTWNPTSQTWVQEREDWTSFPVATTTTDGAITAGNTSWYYFRFGDTTKAGTYRVLVSLQPVGGGSGMTQNNAASPTVTVLDMLGTIDGQADGFAVHNGVALDASLKGKRAEATSSAAATTVWSLSRTADTASTMPLQLAPSLWTGANATNADFVLGAPAGSAFDLRIQNAIWPAAASSFTGAQADVNVALGAADTTPPSAPGTLSVMSGDATAALSWGAATDATGVTGYVVYRWVEPASGAGYTAIPVAVHTSGASEMTWTDTGLTNGTAYHYVVRAMDAATNVGPRSGTASASPRFATALSFGAAPTTVSWGKPWMLSGELTSGGTAVPDATARLMKSIDGGFTWTLVSTLTPAAGTSTYTGSIAAPTRKTTYHLEYTGDATHAPATSDPVEVTPRVKLGKPVAPSTVRARKAFEVYGSLTPKAPAGSRTVKVRCYLRKSGSWVLKKTVTTRNFNRGPITQYRVSMSLSAKGSWKLVAYAPATQKYAATTSGSEYLRVR